MKTLQRIAQDAHFIWQGACNPIAVANSLIEAIRAGSTAIERHVNSDDFKTAPELAPARIMLAQLAFLAGQGIGDYARVDEDTKEIERLAAPILGSNPL